MAVRERRNARCRNGTSRIQPDFRTVVKHRVARCGNLPFDRPKGVPLLRDVVSRWSGNHGCARAFQRLRRAALSAGRARDRLFNGIPRPPMLAVGGQTTARPGRGRGDRVRVGVVATELGPRAWQRRAIGGPPEKPGGANGGLRGEQTGGARGRLRGEQLEEPGGGGYGGEPRGGAGGEPRGEPPEEPRESHRRVVRVGVGSTGLGGPDQRWRSGRWPSHGGRAMVDELSAEASSRSVYIKRPVKPCQVGLHASCPSGAQRASESRTVAVAESAVSAVTLRVTPNSPTQPCPSWTCLASVRRSASI